jgi:hypothetical protein
MTSTFTIPFQRAKTLLPFKIALTKAGLGDTEDFFLVSGGVPSRERTRFEI